MGVIDGILIASLVVVASARPALAGCGARGFDTTYGTGTTDKIGSGYTGTVASTMTFSAWVFENGTGGAGFGRIFDQNGAVGVTKLIMMDDNSANTNGTWSFGFGGATTYGQWSWTAPSMHAWHHVMVTFNSQTSGNIPTVFVDGSSVAVTTITAFTAPGAETTGSYYVGNRSDSARIWDGKIADFAHWNVILSSNEANSLYRGASPLKIRPASLKMYLPLCGIESNEPDWASRSTQTMTGTKGGSGPPNSAYPFIQTVR